MCLFFFFFFQAEDGIRDFHVTGVQTCALPISLTFYAALAAALLDALGIGRLRWVGTSMGGAIGMKVAGGALRDRISHLVLNDIGPEVADAAVTRIRSYAGNPPRFAKVS